MTNAKKTIKIPAPKVSFGEDVLVLNYRCNPEQWEPGRVESLSYENRWGRFFWSYCIELDRKSAAGRIIRLAVGDSGVKDDQR